MALWPFQRPDECEASGVLACDDGNTKSLTPRTFSEVLTTNVRVGGVYGPARGGLVSEQFVTLNSSFHDGCHEIWADNMSALFLLWDLGIIIPHESFRTRQAWDGVGFCLRLL